jgi:lysophospholipid acyltransferase
VLYSVATLKLKIYTYFTAFMLMETTSIASGLSYDGIDENCKPLFGCLNLIEKPKFTRVQTICVWDIEFSYNVKDFLGAWNISVHKWLKYYIYLRLVKPGKHLQIVPILSTFVVSAIWHGFYPGYFLFFISSGLMDYIFKLG